MVDQLFLVLQITAIGMGLVFAAIIFLTIVLSLLVRFPAKTEPRVEAEVVSKETELKQRAAAVAVAVVLAREAALAPLRFPLPPTALVSAWQAVLRSNILNKRGSSR